MLSVEIAGRAIRLQEHPLVWNPTQWAGLLGSILVGHLKPGMKGLELGVGSGVLSILAGMGGLQVVGLDICGHAIELTRANWALNGLETSRGDFRVSDCFSALTANEQNAFDIVWCNPPSVHGAPSNRWLRNSAFEYQLAGNNGRDVLDAVIRESGKWLRDKGCMVTIATSKQSWKQTQALLDHEWTTWNVIATEDIQLPEYDGYQSLVPFWLEQQREDGEARIFQRESRWFQRLYFIKATK